MLRIIIGLLIVVIGFSMVWKTVWYLRTFGRIRWAERYLGLEGGSRLFYKLLGVVIIFLGVFLATNLLGGIILESVGRFFTSF